MSSSPSAPKPLTLPPRRSRRRLFAVAALPLTLVALLATTAGVGAHTYGSQQSALTAARGDRTSAEKTLDGASRHAESVGVPAAQLAAVRKSERSILDEPSVTGGLPLFDSGEISHVARQAARLRSLVGMIDAIQVGLVGVADVQAAKVLESLAAAVSDEQAAGLDATADLAVLVRARDALRVASTPNAVATATAGLADRSGAIHQAADQKRAADAAAAAQAKFDTTKGDASRALARADRLATQAAAFPQLQIADAVAKIAAEHAAFAAAVTLADYDAVTGPATDAADSISALLSARSGAYAEMASARSVIQQALSDKVDPGTIPAQLDALQPGLDAAGTRPAFDAIRGQVHALIAPILTKIGIAELGVGKVIVITLSNQSLVAYQDGQQFLSTPVTTGRPALPTPTGTFTVLRKNHPWTMTSDWPRSSPYWYPPSVVQYTLWFTNEGHAIHDAPWRASYGPGTEANGSHGCVNVPLSAEATLFGWADVGTRVIIR